MDTIGLTGSTGSLGKILIKIRKKLECFHLKGYTKKKDVNNWLEKI